MPGLPSSPVRRRRGSVLVVVLVTILFAAMLLTRLVESSSTDLLIAMRVADRDHLRADAYGALETTLAVLMDFITIDDGLYAPAQGWADPLGYAEFTPRDGVRLEVAFEDESGKLSLPRMELDTLNALLVRLGLTSSEAKRVADGIFAWTREEHVAAEPETDASAYERRDPPTVPPYRSLRSFAELATIAVARDYFYEADGRPTPLWHEFVRAVSLYQFSTTNVNSASPTALLASGWDSMQADSLKHFLEKQPDESGAKPYLQSFEEVRQQVGAATDRNLGAKIQCLRIHVTAYQGAAQLRVSALVTWGNQASLPASVASKPPKTVSVAANEATEKTREKNKAAPANALRYPFTVLELSETTIPPPQPQPTD